MKKRDCLAAFLALAALPAEASGLFAAWTEWMPAAERGVLCFWLVLLLLLASDVLLCRAVVRAGLRRGRRRGRPLRLENLQPLFLLQLPLLVIILAVSLLASRGAAAPAARPAAAAAAAEQPHRLREGVAAVRGRLADTVQALNIFRKRPEDAAPGDAAPGAAAGKALPAPAWRLLPEGGEAGSGSAAWRRGGWSEPPEAAAGAAEDRPSRESWTVRLWSLVRRKAASLLRRGQTGAPAAAKRAPPGPSAAAPAGSPARPDSHPGAAPAPAPLAAAAVPEHPPRASVQPPAPVRPAAAADVMPAAVPDRGAQRAGDEAVPLVSVAPGRRPPFFAADILFIHAHPDDESLDFGALLARSAAAGLATVTVLFTDGEAGNDRYPRRSVNGDYPDRRLRGRELAALRVREAERALGLLGCRMYVRLGLANHPYNSQSDKLTPEEVIEAWGGEEVLAARLADIIRGFSPRIVVGPDRQSAATEHFEHEAVGQILRRALAMLAAGGGPSPREVLVGVDPRQKSRYRGLIAVPAAEAGNARGESFREIQLRALKEYASQQDAALGLELLPRYRAEYYLPLFNAEEPFLPVAPGD